MSNDPFSGPAITALGLAAARSVESGRPDRLIHDPFARALFLAAGQDLPMRLDWPTAEETVSPAEALHLHGTRYIGLRTRFYDDALTSAARHGVRQAVLLGSGLDTRAYRLPLPPSFALFELDRPDLLAWKRNTIDALVAGPRCRRYDVGLDIRDDWRPVLAEAGFEPGSPTVVIAEGLLPYLTPDEQAELISRVTAIAAAGSVLAADRIAGDPHAHRRLDRLAQRSGIDMQNLIAAGEGQVLSSLTAGGWLVEEQAVAAVAALYHRDLTDPFAGPVAEPASGLGAEPASGPDAEPAPEPPWLDTTFITARRPA